MIQGGWLHRYNLIAVSGYYRPLGATSRNAVPGGWPPLILGYQKKGPSTTKMNVRFRYTQQGSGLGG
jgi:hypothetical protein